MDKEEAEILENEEETPEEVATEEPEETEEGSEEGEAEFDVVREAGSQQQGIRTTLGKTAHESNQREKK